MTLATLIGKGVALTKRITSSRFLRMTAGTGIARTLGTMVVYGGKKGPLPVDLAIARKLGASVLEILPDWKTLPDPLHLRHIATQEGFQVRSAHGCWGSQTIHAGRVDLGSLDATIQGESVDDLRLCLDWLEQAGGTHLVVHPGGLSDQAQVERRREALLDGLTKLADAIAGSKLRICVENMPPGVFPGSRMEDLAKLVAEIDRPEVGLALDTGHAHIANSAPAETLAAGKFLMTTHVHDNNGRADAHLPPGLGTMDWDAWIEALDTIEYRGPIVLECIRYLRERPESLDRALIERLANLTRNPFVAEDRS